MTHPIASEAPLDNDVDQQKPQAGKTFGDVVPVPTLLDEATEDATVCKTIHRLWSDQKDKHARYIVECEVNERRRQGESNIWVRKDQDRTGYSVYVPAGRVNLIDQFGQVADRLCQRFVSQLNQDPAKANAIPSTGEDEDRDAAEFTTRILSDVCSESGLDANEAIKQAQDYACSHGSGWIWTYTDPMGSRQGVEVDARTTPVPHPDPTQPPIAPPEHVDEAMTDPTTGGDWQGPTERRFVSPQGQLTPNKADAALRWVPKVARQVVTGSHVRLWPFTAADVWDANGLLYFDYQPWNVAAQWFPELKDLPEEDRNRALEFRLPDAVHLLPKKNGRPSDPKPEGREEDWLVLIACFWAPEGSAYPDGAYIACVGDQKVAHRDTWTLQSPDGTRERRDIPWTQVRQFRGTREHPQGKPLMGFIGAGGEYLGQLYGRFEELMDAAAARKIFLPYNSTIQPQDLHDPGNGVLYCLPGQEPQYEQVPEPPKSLNDMLTVTRDDLNDASGLQETGQGLQSDNVNSGRQALAIVAQVNAGLSDVLQNQNRAWVRLFRIVLQCIRSDWSVPQLLRTVGVDGSYKVDRWTRSDLGSTRDVEIAKGSGTMLNPMQKTQLLGEMRQLAGIDPDDVQEMMATGVSPYVNFQDNAFLGRIRRQIEQWEQGPPDGWQPPQAPINPDGTPVMQPPPVDPATGMIPSDPATGLPAPGQPVQPPPDPLLAQIWAPVDSDMSPIAAKWRIREIARAQQSSRYFTFDPAWRMGLDMEYRRMQQALTPPPPPMAPGKPGAPAGDGKPGLSPTEQAMEGQQAA